MMGNLNDRYDNYLIEQNQLRKLAVDYILKNYKQITDWNSCTHRIIHDDGEIIYGKYEIKTKKRTISYTHTIHTIKFVYDKSDDDLGLVINGNDFLCISFDTIMKFACFIERKLIEN